MAEATDNRKEETTDFKILCALDSAAKQILPAFTKDRLNKFYNPKLYKPEETMMVQVRAHDAPPPPGAYQKKSEDSGGVISMIDLIAELDKELTEAGTKEKLVCPRRERGAHGRLCREACHRLQVAC